MVGMPINNSIVENDFISITVLRYDWWTILCNNNFLAKVRSLIKSNIMGTSIFMRCNTCYFLSRVSDTPIYVLSHSLTPYFSNSTPFLLAFLSQKVVRENHFIIFYTQAGHVICSHYTSKRKSSMRKQYS